MLEKQQNLTDQKPESWEKSGDFSIILKGRDLVKRSVQYRNSDDAILELLEYKNLEYKDYELVVIFSFENNRKLIRNLSEKLKTEGIAVKIDELGRYFRFSSIDRKKIAYLLNILDTSISISSIKKEIFVTLSLNLIANQAELFNELIKLLEESNLDGAIKKAKSVEDDDILFRLGKYCEENKKFQQSLEIYQEIDQENLYYAKANSRAFNLVTQYPSYFDKGNNALTLEELKLRLLLRSNTNQYTQDFIDQYYYQLSGSKDFNSQVKNIKCDTDTLIKLAKSAYDLRNETDNLQLKSFELEQETALLRENLKKQKKESNYPKAFFKLIKKGHEESGSLPNTKWLFEEQQIPVNRKAENWEKRGDFSILYNGHKRDRLNRRVIYYNANNETLHLCGYKDNSLKVGLAFPDNRKFIRDLSEKLKAKGLPVRVDGRRRYFEFSSTDKRKIAHLLNILDTSISISSIKKRIFVELDLNEIPNQPEFFNELITLLEEDNVTGAISQAKSIENDDILYRLGKYCEEQGKLSQALEIYQEVAHNNLHYTEANSRAFDIVIHYQSYLDQIGEVLTSEKKRELEELKVKFLLLSNTNQLRQDMLDQHFYQLSGGKDLKPKIKQIKCDEKTLIGLAEETCELRKEIHNLKLRIFELEQEVAFLKEQLKTSNSNESLYPKTFFNLGKEKDQEGNNSLSNTNSYNT